MLKIWSITDVGLVRKDNQDAFAVREQTPTGHTICVVCDGMGGVTGGRVASQIASSTFVEELERVLSPDMTPQQLREASSYAVSLANRAIREKAREIVEYEGMGTTLVSAVSYDGGVVITNVGDSRAYHISGGTIRRVTKDHSLVESLVDRGDITAEEARRHPSRNLITRALGPDPQARSDGYICPLEPGDFLLLCTDGMVDTVTDPEMLREVLRESPETCLERLLAISKSRGASDNVTAVLVQKL